MYVFLAFEKGLVSRPSFRVFRVLLPHRRRIAVSSETKPSALNVFYSCCSEPRINNVKSAKLLCVCFSFSFFIFSLS